MGRRARILLGLASLLTLAALFAGCAGKGAGTVGGQGRAPSGAATRSPETSCTPTLPNGQSPPGEPVSPDYFGNGAIFTVVWPRGVVVFEPGGPGEVRGDGSLAMKWGFVRGAGVSGPLAIEGRSLHRPGLKVSAEIADGYGPTGFQATTLVFPERGCWEVTARVGDASLTFVTRVESRY